MKNSAHLPVLASRIFDGHFIRFTVRAAGPWFVAKDVCDALEIRNSRDATKRLEPDELVSVATTSGGQRRELQFISESGLYALTFQSRKPEAKKFRRWVTKEVLPAIRREGFYAAHGIDPRVARVEQGKLLLEQARLLRREAEMKAREAKALLNLEGCTSVLDFLTAHGLPTERESHLAAVRAVVTYTRQHQVPTGRDAAGRMTAPEEALRAALDLDQANLPLN